MRATEETCTCGRPERGMTCRCTCEKCGSLKLTWVAWGVYLDKDLCCDSCDHVQDVWEC